MDHKVTQRIQPAPYSFSSSKIGNTQTSEVVAWAKRNFGNQDPSIPLLGVVEELGELSRAFIKNKLKIRGYADEEVFRTKVKDALCDIIVFMIVFADSINIDLVDSFENEWRNVRTRDWVKYPKNGVDK